MNPRHKWHHTELGRPVVGATPKNHGSDMTKDEIEFAMACDREKRHRGVVMLTCGQILAVARSLGYRRDQNAD